LYGVGDNPVLMLVAVAAGLPLPLPGVRLVACTITYWLSSIECVLTIRPTWVVTPGCQSGYMDHTVLS
jgi:hypothetical protein